MVFNIIFLFFCVGHWFLGHIPHSGSHQSLINNEADDTLDFYLAFKN
jgi:hypothetical protein